MLKKINKNIIVFLIILAFLSFSSANFLLNDFEIEDKEDVVSLKHGDLVKIIPHHSSDFNIGASYLTRLECCVGEDCNPLARDSCYPDNICRIWGKQAETQYIRCQVYGHSNGVSNIVENSYIVYGVSKSEHFLEISEDGVRYDPELFRHFFMLNQIPIEIEMRPLWRANYDFSEEENQEIKENRDNLINFLNYENSEPSLSGQRISVNVSKELLLTLLGDRRIGRIDLPIRPNTPYEFWFKNLPRSILNNSSFLLIFLSFLLSIFIIFQKKRYRKEEIKNRRLFSFVNLSFLPLYFIYVILIVGGVCGGTNFLVFPILSLIIGSLIWSFIYSNKYKFTFGRVIFTINILILVFVFFQISRIGCIS